MVGGRVVKCEQCGELFEAFMPREVLCSPKCIKAAKAQRVVRWRARKKVKEWMRKNETS